MTAAQDYRRDIDGLRALAILPVLLYHAHVPFVTGGYVGVDGFFVISGFLITRIIAREIDARDFSIMANSSSISSCTVIPLPALCDPKYIKIASRWTRRPTGPGG